MKDMLDWMVYREHWEEQSAADMQHVLLLHLKTGTVPHGGAHSLHHRCKRGAS